MGGPVDSMHKFMIMTPLAYACAVKTLIFSALAAPCVCDQEKFITAKEEMQLA